MVDGTSPPLRARHDAGRPPYAWRRMLVLVGSLGVTTGLTVTGAGLLRQGPLAWLGWSEQVLAPQQVMVTGDRSSAVRLEVAVRGDGVALCPQDLRVEADQGSAARVVIRRVVAKAPRFTLLGTGCGERRSGPVMATLRLDRPLRDRQVVDGAGHPFAVRLDLTPG